MNDESFRIMFWAMISLIAISIPTSIVVLEYVESDYKECIKKCIYVEDSFKAECLHQCNQILINNTECNNEQYNR